MSCTVIPLADGVLAAGVERPLASKALDGVVGGTVHIYIEEF